MQAEMSGQIDYAKAIAAIVAAMPAERRAQVYEYALFLQTRQNAVELQADIDTDEALWDAQFAATDERKLAALIQKVEADIHAGHTSPMFDEHGEFIEP